MTLRFQEIFLTERCFLFNGPLASRLRCQTDIIVSAQQPIFNNLYKAKGAMALQQLYLQDCRLAESQNYPIMLCTPTATAQADIVKDCGYKMPESISKINQDAVRFLTAIRQQFTEFDEGIFVTGVVGPRMAWQGQCGFTVTDAETYHTPQIQALTQAKADVLLLSDMNNQNETIGAAQAAAKADNSYGIGFVANEDGTLLDGSRIEDVIRAIDTKISPRPFFYALTCMHAAVAQKILTQDAPQLERILAVRLHAENKTAAQFSKMKYPSRVGVEDFVEANLALKAQHPIKVWGGCCGTDHRHLNAFCHALI